MNRNELIDRIAWAEKDLAFLKQLKTNCSTCETLRNGICTRFKAAPPPDFAAVGCEHWDFDDIPF